MGEIIPIGIIGGILLIIGAYFTYKGNIYKSMLVYLLADVIWVLLSFLHQDYLGAVLIIIGASLGVLAFIKMHNGTFRKTLI